MSRNSKTPTDLNDDDLDVASGAGLEMNAWLEAAQAGEMSGVTSPRDAASSMATGKRQHKPFVAPKPRET